MTGANPFRTMMLTWKYTLPAFLVPFVFTLNRAGTGVLLQGSWTDVIVASSTAAVGVGALAAGFGGWVVTACSLPERVAFVVAGLFLLYAAPWADITGLSVAIVVFFLHLMRSSRAETGGRGR